MTTTISRTRELKDLSDLKIVQAFQKSKYLSIKNTSYFQVYEQLFSKFIGKPITFVEVGILGGGSLFMWREFFGPNARIIGVDLNPNAKKWEKEGFEIYIGSQSDPAFWDSFFEKIGPIDVLLDDGGHTNQQQIITFDKALLHIKNGGILMIEDVHTSYYKEFGNPSRYSFVNFAKSLTDSINSRFTGIPFPKRRYSETVYSVSFFESIVVFHIDATKCFDGKMITNNGLDDHAEDYRHNGAALGLIERVRHLSLSSSPLLRRIVNRLLFELQRMQARIENYKVRKYFN